MKLPKVSVVIPSYNYGRYLSECLRSIQSQTYQDYELIVVDDGSTDNTEQVVAAHNQLFEKNQFRYIHQSNAGVSAARNTGIYAAQGEFITFIDADDLWLPTYLENQVAAMESNPLVSLCYTGYTFFDSQSREHNGKSFDFKKPAGTSLTALLIENTCSASGVITRADLIRALDGFDRRFSNAADWHMWLRLAASGRVEVIREPLVLYRVHGNAMSGDSLNMNTERAQVFREIYQAYRHRISMPRYTKRRQLAQLEYNVVMGHIHRREWTASLQRLLQAMVERPFWWRLYAQTLRCIYCFTAEKVKNANSAML